MTRELWTQHVTRREGAQTVKPSKYRNKRTMVDGRVFDSKREARRYQELCALLRAGEIQRLELRPQFALFVNDSLVADYIGDFRYVVTRTGEVVTEDVKGMKTPVYRLKKKLVLALHNVEIREV